MLQPDFAIVDIETTGLFPRGHDRIIEIAIIRTDASGITLAEYATLVNPNRDLGPTHIHGLQARDVLEAPRFEEIANDVQSLLDGALFVAHNATFDLRFVAAELDRAGAPGRQRPYLCTLQFAREVAKDDLPSRQLVHLCRFFGISLPASHSALHDARAATELLRVCLARGGRAAIEALVGGISSVQPQTFVASVPSCPECRRDRPRPDAPAFIAQLVSKLPAAGSNTAQRDEYHAMLDRVLEDRRVTEAEVDGLRELAESLSLSGAQLRTAHRTYVRDLIRIALADGVITSTEQADLDEVCRLLGISESDYEGLLEGTPGGVEIEPALGRDLSGKTICFTGTLVSRIGGQLVRRQLAEDQAREHGMVVKKGVTRELDFLVTADPDSMSGKAKKAREYGVRILAERVFWQLVGIDIE